jgi:folate-binding protein YgfZ
MTQKTALLPDRTVVRVDGADAEKLLQQIITNEVPAAALRQGAFAAPLMQWALAALLTPQGKVLCDFLIARHGGGFLLDTPADRAAELVRRLELYRLRAQVAIADASGQLVILAAWGEVPAALDAGRAAMFAAADPRLDQLGLRIIADRGAAAEVNATAAEYHAHRIALGVPEGGKDYAYGETFPHEADLDLLNGISFTKGCFIGQEVVSRMRHRGTVRRRVVPVEGEAALTSGAAVTVGAVEIGRIGSVAGALGLAMVRLDRAAEASAKGERLRAGGVAISLRQPAWADFKLAPPEPTAGKA